MLRVAHVAHPAHRGRCINAALGKPGGTPLRQAVDGHVPVGLVAPEQLGLDQAPDGALRGGQCRLESPLGEAVGGDVQCPDNPEAVRQTERAQPYSLLQRLAADERAQSPLHRLWSAYGDIRGHRCIVVCGRGAHMPMPCGIRSLSRGCVAAVSGVFLHGQCAVGGSSAAS